MRLMTRLVLLSAIALVGCGRNDTEPALTPAARTAPAAERAIGALAAARCDHLERCGAIGTTPPVLSRQSCMNTMLADGYQELTRCRSGVDQDAANQCMQVIEESSCQDPLARLDAIENCRAADLCVE